MYLLYNAFKFSHSNTRREGWRIMLCLKPVTSSHKLNMNIKLFLAGLYIPQVHTLVMTELAIGHVPVVPDDFPYMLRGHVLFLRVNKTKLALL